MFHLRHLRFKWLLPTILAIGLATIGWSLSATPGAVFAATSAGVVVQGGSPGAPRQLSSPAPCSSSIVYSERAYSYRGRFCGGHAPYRHA